MNNKTFVKNIKRHKDSPKPGFLNQTAPTATPTKTTVNNKANKNDIGDGFVAPDGGWGWLVAIASGVSIVVTYPVLQQFGILFRNKFSQIGITSSELTTIINVQQAMAMCAGLINGPLFRRFSHRQAALIGNFFVFSGLFLAAFANSFITYLISISLLYGTGRGIMFSTITVTLLTYFKKKRQEATAYKYIVASIGPISLPYVVTFFVSYYGVTGTVLLLSGLSLNNLACSAIYQPVKWHARKAPRAITPQDLELPIDKNSFSEEILDMLSTSALELNSPVNGNLQNVTVGNEPIKTKSLREEEELLEKNCQNKRKIEDPEAELSFFQKIVDIFDLTLLKNFGYVNIVVGITLMNMVHMNFHYLTPFILTEFGLDSQQIAAAMTVEALTTLVGKFTIALIAAKIECNCKICLTSACLALSLGRLILTLNRNYFAVLVCFGWIGFNSAIFLIFGFITLPSYVPLHRLPAAVGLQRLIMGLCNFTLGPFIGLIRDASSYSFVIHIMNLVIVIVALAWLSEGLVKRRRHRLKIQNKSEIKS